MNCLTQAAPHINFHVWFLGGIFFFDLLFKYIGHVFLHLHLRRCVARKLPGKQSWVDFILVYLFVNICRALFLSKLEFGIRHRERRQANDGRIRQSRGLVAPWWLRIRHQGAWKYGQKKTTGPRARWPHGGGLTEELQWLDRQAQAANIHDLRGANTHTSLRAQWKVKMKNIYSCINNHQASVAWAPSAPWREGAIKRAYSLR